MRIGTAVAALGIVFSQALLVSANARADVVYQYTGSLYNYGLFVTAPSEAFTASIDATSSLAPNSTYTFDHATLSSGNSVIVGFSINGASSSGGADLSGSVSTNAAGSIVSWNLANAGFPNNSGQYSSSTPVAYSIGNPNFGGFPFLGTVPLYDAVIYNDGAVDDFAYGSSVAGTWTASTVPLPGAVWLMLSGLSYLGLLVRKRRAA